MLYSLSAKCLKKDGICITNLSDLAQQEVLEGRTSQVRSTRNKDN
ncbi:hypothetical protein [Cuspidothrix issatschenkoi]|nr:hypothetical protein [Cuspidothrix issatschenkoi]